MKRRDYRYASENKFIIIDVQFLSKYFGTKHYTITHSSIKKRNR